jgi:hypothetical protein
MTPGVFLDLGPLATLESLDELAGDLTDQRFHGQRLVGAKVVHDSDSIRPL